jgi:hypothetical protein
MQIQQRIGVMDKGQQSCCHVSARSLVRLDRCVPGANLGLMFR